MILKPILNYLQTRNYRCFNLNWRSKTKMQRHTNNKGKPTTLHSSNKQTRISLMTNTTQYNLKTSSCIWFCFSSSHYKSTMLLKRLNKASFHFISSEEEHQTFNLLQLLFVSCLLTTYMWKCEIWTNKLKMHPQGCQH